MIKGILVLFLCLFVGNECFATTSDPNEIDSHVLGQENFSVKRFSTSPALVPGGYDQKIDHAEITNGPTFRQRYWIDSEYASVPSTAPVIYHICGEGDAEQGFFLHDNAIEWAKALGANLVYLEHRYYGKSVPFSDLSSDHLKYLTLENIIEDLASFQNWITQTRGWQGKWVVVGGSYSGTLAALYRQRHPELVSAALASSAPMISGMGKNHGTLADYESASSLDPSSDTGNRQWAYQSCTTFGFWEASGPNTSASLFEPSSWLCQKLFGKVALVNKTNYNQNYDLPFLSTAESAPSHIFFTYGSNDIWTKIGLSVQTNANSKIVVRVIKGAVHHYDLNAPSASDSAEVKAARAQFLELVLRWLQ